MDPTFTDFEFSYSNLEINIQAKYGILSWYPYFDFTYTLFQNVFDDWSSNIQ